MFKTNRSTGNESVVYSFADGSDGGYPIGLIAVGATLFGTNSSGGPSPNLGTVFKVNPNTGVETVLYAFKGGSDGVYPGASPLYVGGTLFGTTREGGSGNVGTVYKVNASTGAESVLYAFKGGMDGAYPSAPLINVVGILYGTTAQGGANNCGTVFQVNPNTGAERVVYTFTGGADGGNPLAGLLNVGGTLYGSTEAGGAFGDGTVFKVNPSTGTETVLHSFKDDATDGGRPHAELINVGGMLYGTTSQGGAFNAGTVFQLDPSTGVESIVYAFKGGKDGAIPYTSLLNFGGTLYGVTNNGGGPSSAGIVFAIKP